MKLARVDAASKQVWNDCGDRRGRVITIHRGDRFTTKGLRIATPRRTRNISGDLAAGILLFAHSESFFPCQKKNCAKQKSKEWKEKVGHRSGCCLGCWGADSGHRKFAPGRAGTGDGATELASGRFTLDRQRL